MVRIFASPKMDPSLVLAACKFLDLVLVLPCEQFNIHEWIFITNCSHHPDHKNPSFVPYVDHLAQPTKQFPNSNIPKLNVATSPKQLRQPLIVVKNIDDIEQLKCYLFKFSQLCYLNSVTHNPPDYQFIDLILGLDFIESSSQKLPQYDQDQPTTSANSSSENSQSSDFSELGDDFSDFEKNLKDVNRKKRKEKKKERKR